MRAVRSTPPGVTVVDVDVPGAGGEVVKIRFASAARADERERFAAAIADIREEVRHEAGSAVPGRFLSELHAGAESKFGVDVGEVGLHGAR